MVDQVDVVQFLTPTATGTVDITSPNITEAFSAAIVIFSHVDDVGVGDGVDNASGWLGMGFVAAVAGGGVGNGVCLAALLRDAQTSTQTFNDHSTNQAVRGSTNAGVVDVVGAYDSAISGGFRLNFTTVPGGGVRIRCTAIIFAGLANAATGSVTQAAGSGHEAVGVGGSEFTPDALFFLAADANLALGADDGIVQLGAALNLAGIPQKAAYINVDRSSNPTGADGYLRSAAATAAFNGAVRTDMERLTVDSFDATGFNCTATPSQVVTLYLALKWTNPSRVRIAVANMAVAASTGNQAFNGFGFTPDVAFGVASLLTSEDAIETGASCCAAGYFVTGKLGSRAYTYCHDRGHTINAGNRTVTRTRVENVGLLLYDTTAAIVQRATWVGGSGSGGFVLNFSTASTAGFLTAVGIQIIPSPPLGRRLLRALKRAPRRRRRVRVRVSGGSFALPPLRTAARSRRRRRVRPVWRPRRLKALAPGRRVGPPPIVRGIWKDIGRIRRALGRRLRWRPAPPETATPPIAIVLDQPPTGRIAQPGLVRGRIVTGGEQLARAPQPGMVRGRIVGASIKQPEEQT